MSGNKAEFVKALDDSEKAIKQSKWNFENSIDLFSAGLTARAIETGYSMVYAGDESPDNTLYIMLRHLFETAVRLRYLCLDPNNHIQEIMLGSTQSALKGIGRKPQHGESAPMAKARQDNLQEEITLIAKVKTIQSKKKGKKVENASVPTVFDMCEKVGSSDLYSIYRILSGVEHSSWQGLQATVYDNSGGTNNIVIGKKFDDMTSDFVWNNASVLLKSITGSISELTSKRPQVTSN